MSCSGYTWWHDQINNAPYRNPKQHKDRERREHRINVNCVVTEVATTCLWFSKTKFFRFHAEYINNKQINVLAANSSKIVWTYKQINPFLLIIQFWFFFLVSFCFLLSLIFCRCFYYYCTFDCSFRVKCEYIFITRESAHTYTPTFPSIKKLFLFQMNKK